MAIEWPVRPSGGQPIESEAEGLQHSHQSSVANADSEVALVEDEQPAVKGRKGSVRSRTSTLLSRSKSMGRGEEKVKGLSPSKSRAQQEEGSSSRELRGSRSRSRTLSAFEHEGDGKKLPDLPALPLPRINCSEFDYFPMIGVAVGSPSQLQHPAPDSVYQASLPTIEADLPTPLDSHLDASKSKTKGARWRKIGGMFKAKNAFLNEPETSSLNSLQATHTDRSRTQPEPSLHARSQSPTLRDQDPKYLFDKILGANGQIDPRSYSEHSLDYPFGGRGGNSWSETRQKGTKIVQVASRPTLPKSSQSLLDVSIPNVQMERYSVMFGSLLGKEESSNLLARRGETADRLVPISSGDEESRGLANVPKELSISSQATSGDISAAGLKPESHGLSARRATSPTSPVFDPLIFSLFPQSHQAPENKSVGGAPAGRQSPLRRSFTEPCRLSPMQENGGGDAKIVVSPPEITGATESIAQSSTNSSSSSSANQDQPPHPKSLDATTPQNSRTRPTTEHEFPAPPSKLAPSPTIDQGRNDVEVEMGKAPGAAETRIDVNQDTLAALERPRSQTFFSDNFTAGLEPSRARVDRIMGTAPSNQPSRPPEPRKDEDANAMEGPSRSAVGASRLSEEVEDKQKRASGTMTAAAESSVQETPASSNTHVQEAATLPITGRQRPPLGSQHSLPLTQAAPKIATRPHPPRHDSAVGRVLGYQTRQRDNLEARHTQPTRFPAESRNVSRPSASVHQSRHGTIQNARPPPGGDRTLPRQPPARLGTGARLPPRPALHQIPRSQRPLMPSKATQPSTEEDQDNILEYYLDEVRPSARTPLKLPATSVAVGGPANGAVSVPEPSRPRRRRVLSPIKSSPTMGTEAGRAPLVPTSKYSPKKASAGFSKPLPSPVPSSAGSTQSRDSSTDQPRRTAVKANKVKHSDAIFLSSTSRSASAVEVNTLRAVSSNLKASPASTSKHSDAAAVVKPSPTSPGAKTLYSHSNASSPNVIYTGATTSNTTASSPTSSSSSPSQSQSPSSSSSSSSSVSASPSESPTLTTTKKPTSQPQSQHPLPQPPHLRFVYTRSSSAPIATTTTTTTRTVSPTSRIRLDPTKGEKVVECRAGLLPRIVDRSTTNDTTTDITAAVTPSIAVQTQTREGGWGGEAKARGPVTAGREYGHRAERSVNLVIESV